MAMKKNPVSGKTVKTTTYNLLTPLKKNVKMVNERTTRKPTVKPAPMPKPKITAKPKPKGLNDYLDKGQTPPSKNKKLPSDADVILKGYNDKKTIAKSKASKKKKGM
jgi:hypothetical protein